MLGEIGRFLEMVLASVCGILIGAALAQGWEKIRWKWRRRK